MYNVTTNMKPLYASSRKKLKDILKLSEKEKWLIDELFFCGKSERELSIETGIPRRTVGYRKKE